MQGLKLVAPTIEKRTVMPRRAKNADLRTREYLTEQEVEALMAAARQNRHGHRDATMILVAFRHGLRASEAVDLRWDQVDFTAPSCTSAGSSGAHPACTRSGRNCAPFAACSARARPARSCSSASGARRSPPPGLPG